MTKRPAEQAHTSLFDDEEDLRNMKARRVATFFSKIQNMFSAFIYENIKLFQVLNVILFVKTKRRSRIV